MRYRVTIEGTEHEVDVQLTEGGKPTVSLDGRPFDGDIRVVPGGLSLRIGTRVHDVFVGGKAERLSLASGEHRVFAEVQSERARARAKKAGGAGGAQKEIRAPMPGRIVKVLVAPGDSVAAQQSVIIMEAMKMENELRAAAAGKVASVHVKEGDNVEGALVLVRLE